MMSLRSSDTVVEVIPDRSTMARTTVGYWSSRIFDEPEARMITFAAPKVVMSSLMIIVFSSSTLVASGLRVNANPAVLELTSSMSKVTLAASQSLVLWQSVSSQSVRPSASSSVPLLQSSSERFVMSCSWTVAVASTPIWNLPALGVKYSTGRRPLRLDSDCGLQMKEPSSESGMPSPSVSGFSGSVSPWAHSKVTGGSHSPVARHA